MHIWGRWIHYASIISATKLHFSFLKRNCKLCMCSSSTRWVRDVEATTTPGSLRNLFIRYILIDSFIWKYATSMSFIIFLFFYHLHSFNVTLFYYSIYKPQYLKTINWWNKLNRYLNWIMWTWTLKCAYWSISVITRLWGLLCNIGKYIRLSFRNLWLWSSKLFFMQHLTCFMLCNFKIINRIAI